jgi:hypothetical protein
MSIGDCLSGTGIIYQLSGILGIETGVIGGIAAGSFIAEGAVAVTAGALAGAIFLPITIGVAIGGGLLYVGSKLMK